jgi:hypothetical protein
MHRHRYGIIASHNLERVVHCILDIGLPIQGTHHDCCIADVLWAKIFTDGLTQKDWTLYLVILQMIGQRAFFGDIKDINADLLMGVMLADRYCAVNTKHRLQLIPRTNTYGNAPSIHSLPIHISLHKSILFSSRTMIIVILGASGDTASQLVRYFVQTIAVRVICSVQQAALPRFKIKVGINIADPTVHVLAGDVIDLRNLCVMIWEEDVLYHMIGIVTLGSQYDKYLAVITLDGHIQAIIAHFVRVLGRSQSIKIIYPCTQRVYWITSNVKANAWIREAAATFFMDKDVVVMAEDIYCGVSSCLG